MSLFYISVKKFTRYYQNPTFLSVFLSHSFSSKTLINPFSRTSSNIIFHSKQLRTSISLYSFSTGLVPDSSLRFLLYGFFTTSCYFPLLSIHLHRHHKRFLIPPLSVNFYSKSVDSDKKSLSEDMGHSVLDGSEHRKSNVVGFEPGGNYKHGSEIIEVIRSGDSDMGSNLSLVCSNLSVRSINEIFRVLNCEKRSALHFFQWVRVNNPKLCNNYDICSLIISNCGWLEDYEMMIVLLKEFRSKGICLTEKAFDFLGVLTSNKASIMDAIRRVIGSLNEVGGSCRGSGICSLIKMLCSLESFEIAKFVIEITEKNASHYNIIIRERCRKCYIGQVHEVLEEMRELGCDPNIKTYNCLLSHLCKHGRMPEACSLIELMEESVTPPDALTFDILIYNSCKLGKMDIARQYFNQMAYRGLQPRVQTHVAFVKSYFYGGKYEEALQYVRNLDNKYLHSSNMLYSLLGYLHQQKGNLITAQSILIEMMEKGLKPNVLVYIKTLKWLERTGEGSLVGDLRSRFSRFT